MASNPIIVLMTKELLTAKNFMKGKYNINIVLISDNSKFVVTENKPDFLGENAMKSVREKYDRWTFANNKAKAYMPASMSEMLKNKMEDVKTAFDIMEQLQEMFGHKSAQASFKAPKKYVNCMAPGNHVRDHFIKITNYFHEVELHGAIVDEKTQVGIILNSLGANFLMLTMNYFLNKLDYGMA
ncbi:uncharacterized protein LOC133825130 [Humulus lupulus]|uniref:uncharacterized protein LOC133825130 n=1 Tax=Humulus lupulus TaxID=3486 RepID=UPI002B41124D|nr:uncharacterized protein LOC133825130 [Humulus lupulus]